MGRYQMTSILEDVCEVCGTGFETELESNVWTDINCPDCGEEWMVRINGTNAPEVEDTKGRG